jgi:hypothetical protein
MVVIPFWMRVPTILDTKTSCPAVVVVVISLADFLVGGDKFTSMRTSTCSRLGRNLLPAASGRRSTHLLNRQNPKKRNDKKWRIMQENKIVNNKLIMSSSDKLSSRQPQEIRAKVTLPFVHSVFSLSTGTDNVLAPLSIRMTEFTQPERSCDPREPPKRPRFLAD